MSERLDCSKQPKLRWSSASLQQRPRLSSSILLRVRTSNLNLRRMRSRRSLKSRSRKVKLKRSRMKTYRKSMRMSKIRQPRVNWLLSNRQLTRLQTSWVFLLEIGVEINPADSQELPLSSRSSRRRLYSEAVKSNQAWAVP